jgi:hypothetical protein
MPSPNFRCLCLTISFVISLAAYTIFKVEQKRDDDLLLFFVWATFIPLFYSVVVAPLIRRGPHS